jgi:hypothetical protein
MRVAKRIVLCLALLCATSLLHSSAQSGRTPSPQPTSSPTPDSKSSKSGVGTKTPRLDTEPYKVGFSPDGSLGGFIDQLNRHGAEGYRLKSAVHGFQRFAGTYYSMPVAILQADETQFEYALFEATSRIYFAIPGFEPKYAEQAKKGFRLVDHFRTHVGCREGDSDSIPTAADCESTYLFLLEREKNSPGPRDFVVAEAAQTWKRQPGGPLASAIMDKLANGFFPARVLANNQLLLAHADKEDFESEAPEVQVVNSSFMDPVKEKIKKLGQQGFRLSLIGDECAVMSRRPNEHEPVVYEWLNVKNKNFDKELARLQASGATYRLLYRDPYGGNQLVFERQATGSTRGPEYKVLKLSFQLLERQALKDSVNVRVDLTPEAKETVKLMNTLARQGFVVRDLFIPDNTSKSIGVLLERSR